LAGRENNRFGKNYSEQQNKENSRNGAGIGEQRVMRDRTYRAIAIMDRGVGMLMQRDNGKKSQSQSGSGQALKDFSSGQTDSAGAHSIITHHWI